MGIKANKLFSNAITTGEYKRLIMVRKLTMSEIRKKLKNDIYKKRYAEKEIDMYQAGRGADVIRRNAMFHKRLPK